MKKLKIILALMLAAPAFGAVHAADLGGGYTDAQQLKEDAIHAVLTLSGPETLNKTTDEIYNNYAGVHSVPNLAYDIMKLNIGLKRIILGIKKDIVTFVYNNKLELGGVFNAAEKSLGNALGHHNKGNSKYLKQWVNRHVTEAWYYGFDGEGQLDVNAMPDVNAEYSLEEKREVLIEQKTDLEDKLAHLARQIEEYKDLLAGVDIALAELDN